MDRSEGEFRNELYLQGMDRKDFIRTGLLGTGVFVTGAAALGATSNGIDELTGLRPLAMPPDVVGFNHLPAELDEAGDHYVVHRAATRGHANRGWLDTHHTFSFSSYYNPERMHFGALRVINDDAIAGGRGFGTHPHDNMEIVTIPLEGDLRHRDSMGNTSVIAHGDVQVMSAGTGITHSEFNANPDREVKLLQIWMFPKRRSVEPRYGQISLDTRDRHNRFQQILSPSPDDDGVWVHQDAWFHMGRFDRGRRADYDVRRPGNGVYAFVVAGAFRFTDTALDLTLETRDGLGIWNVASLHCEALTDGAELLLMDVPMVL